MMELDLAYHNTDLEQIMSDSWFERQREIDCHNCNTRTQHDVDVKFVATPQVLRIEINLSDIDELGHITKLSHPRAIPQKLDLRLQQINSQLPLTYQLSSAIAHGGDGGCTERFGDNANGEAQDHDAQSGEEDQNVEKAASEADNNSQAGERESNNDVSMHDLEGVVDAQRQDEGNDAIPVPDDENNAVPESNQEIIATPHPSQENNATPQIDRTRFSNAPNAPRSGRRDGDIQMIDAEEEPTPRSRRRNSIFVFDGLVEVTRHDPLDMLDSDSDDEEQPAARAEVKQASLGRRVLRRLNQTALERRGSSSDDTLAAESSSEDYSFDEFSDVSSDEDFYGAPSPPSAAGRDQDMNDASQEHDIDAAFLADGEVNDSPQAQGQASHPYFGDIASYTGPAGNELDDSSANSEGQISESSRSSTQYSPDALRQLYNDPFVASSTGSPADSASSASNNGESEDESSNSSHHSSAGIGGGAANARRCGGCGQVGHIKTNKKYVFPFLVFL